MPGAPIPKVFVVIPVFNRIDETLSCIEDLRAQHYPNLEIVVVDGGSTDDTVARLTPLTDVHLISGVGEQWWTGATWFGIEYALDHGGTDDFVMLLNNDTSFGPEMVDVLVAESIRLGAAIAPVARASDGSVVNAGTWIDWSRYEITQRMTEPKSANATWEVGVLEGRGSLVPIRAIRQAGNVDREHLPHYAGDYEFSLRLARHGCRLMTTNRTEIEVEWDAALIRRYSEPASFRRLWWELTDKRSFANLQIHLRLIELAAPPGRRWKLKVWVLVYCLEHTLRRTPLRHVPGMTMLLPGSNQLQNRIKRIVARRWWFLRN